MILYAGAMVFMIFAVPPYFLLIDEVLLGRCLIYGSSSTSVVLVRQWYV